MAVGMSNVAGKTKILLKPSGVCSKTSSTGRTFREGTTDAVRMPARKAHQWRRRDRVEVIMRIWIMLCLCAVLSRPVSGQKPETAMPEPLKRADELQKAIERFLFGGFIEGHDIKRLRWAGDSTAVAMTKVISDHKITKEQIDSAVYILNAAFSDATGIEFAPDREPRSALFVLRYLDLCTTDPALKAKIAQASERLARLVSKPAESN